MIGVAPKAEGDIVQKTEVLRASADELALKTNDQGKDIEKLRNAIDTLKSDHSNHITSSISRMSEIDNELKHISEEKIHYDRQTSVALKEIEHIRRDLVQLGAKLAKEFIMLPQPVPRYPRLDRSHKRDEMVQKIQQQQQQRSDNNNHQHTTDVMSMWYTDDQPAANLQCIDLAVASAIAALDGRISDEDFKAELDAAKNDPDSIFSKESLIKSVAASSPMKRRRASLLMLSQASKELSKQSSTFDDLTRGPMRWKEVERIQAERTAQEHDAMIRDAVKELCKDAPIPRQAERQMLTAIDLHPMPTYSSSTAVSSSVPSPKDASGLQDVGEAVSPTKSVRITQPANLRAKPTTQLKRKAFSTNNYLANVSMESIGASVEKYAEIGSSTPVYHGDDARKRKEAEEKNSFYASSGNSLLSQQQQRVPGTLEGAKDPLLRQLQAELQEEQSAMGLRSHAARIKAWQELDMKRTARNRFNAEDVSNSNNLVSAERKYGNNNNNNTITSPDRNNAHQQNTTINTAQRLTNAELEAEKERLKQKESYIDNEGEEHPILNKKSAAGVFSVVMNQANVLASPSACSPPRDSASPSHHQHYYHNRSSATKKGSFSKEDDSKILFEDNNNHNEDDENRENRENGGKKLITTMKSISEDPNLMLYEAEQQQAQMFIPNRFKTPPPQIQGQQRSPSPAPSSARNLGLSSEKIDLSPLTVHRSTGLVLRPKNNESGGGGHQHQVVGQVVRRNKNLQSSSIIMSSSSVSDDERQRSTSPNPIAFDNSSTKMVNSTTGIIPRPPSRSQSQQSQHPQKASSLSQLSVARAGIPDPETATQAVTMRRTGALGAASLSFQNSRLDSAAAKLGIKRPPSAGGGRDNNPASTKFNWKLKNKPHDLEEAARQQQQDPKSVD